MQNGIEVIVQSPENELYPCGKNEDGTCIDLTSAESVQGKINIFLLE